MGGAAGNPGPRKSALGVAERHPGPLRRNKKLGGRFVVLQAGRDLSVEDIEFRVGLFVRIAIAFVQLGLAETGSVAALGCLKDRSDRACDQRQADEQTTERDPHCHSRLAARSI